MDLPRAGAPLDSAHVLALDVGSSSVRATCYGANGRQVRSTVVKLEYTFRSTPDGGAEVDPEQLFELVVRAIDRCLEIAGPRLELAGVGVSTFWHGICGLDRAGEPTTPILTWADRRCARQAADLRARLDEAAVHHRTGCVLHSSYPPAKLLWLRDTRPDQFAATAHWVSPGELLLHRFTGELRVGTSMAAASGLYDQARRAWDGELLETVGLGRAGLSPIDDGRLPGLAPDWAGRWPALAAAAWYPAWGDGACSNVGSGCTDRTRLAIMIGTSGALRTFWPATSMTIPTGLFCYRFDGSRFLVGGALSEGGNIYAWLRDRLRLPDDAELRIAGLAPDRHRLTMLPLLAGERDPGWADQAAGAIDGITLATTPLDLLRAGLEAVALRFAQVAEMIDAALPGQRAVVASGGGAVYSPIWGQILADALGKPVTISGVSEASSRGAALLALEALDGLDLGNDHAPLGTTFRPVPEHHAAYRVALARQRELYDALVRPG